MGLRKGLKRFLDESQCHLAISMHNPFAEERGALMPAERSFPLTEVLELLRQYDWTGQRRLTFEYIVFGGNRSAAGDPAYAANHTQRHVRQLVALLMEKVPDTADLASLDEALNGPDAALSRDFCARGCRGHAGRKNGVQVLIDGKALKLTAEQEALLRSWAQEAQA